MIEHLGLTHLLPGVTFAAEFSPFLVNDIVCLVMALAMNICRGMTVRPRPYLLPPSHCFQRRQHGDDYGSAP